MVKTGIMFLLAITLLGLILALSVVIAAAPSINLSYPGNVTSWTAFNITLNLTDFSEGIYDVKIDIYNSSNSSERLSEIYNGTVWKSTNYYVNDIMNTSATNSSVFQLNITSNYSGIANITVRIKNSAESYETFEGYQLNVSSANVTSNNDEDEEEETDITIELEWNEDDIVNGEDFGKTVNVENLEDEDYDILVEILNEDDDIISETYGNRDDEDVWKSSRYYVEEVFSGDGDDSDEIKLRIDSDNEDFADDATIIGKIRETGSSTVIDEFEDDIEVLEAEEEEEEEDDSSSSSSSKTSSSNTKNSAITSTTGTITLGGSGGTSSQEGESGNSIIYKSKNEYIKEYAPYAFGGLCILLIALLLLDRAKGI